MIRFRCNGKAVATSMPPMSRLLDVLREELRYTGPKEGCGEGECGACTVRIDGEIARGCLTLAVQCDGKRVETVEGLSDSGELAQLQSAFHERNALQCGYCTPGMLVACLDLVKSEPLASRERIREHLSGNYCRCTGYHAIVDAVEAVLIARRKGVGT